MTIRQWLRNFWYHHKFKAIIAIVVIPMVSAWIWSMVLPPDYDLKVAVWCGEEENRIEAEPLDKMFEEYSNDFDLNGEINILIKDVSVPSGIWDWKRTAVFKDPQHLIYLVDEATIESLKSGASSPWGEKPMKDLREEFVELEKQYPGRTYIDGAAYALRDSELYRKMREKDSASAEAFGRLYLLLRQKPYSKEKEDANAYENANQAVGRIITEIYRAGSTD